MAATATGRVALFSIKPQYADSILNGAKEVEFRRTALAADVSHVVIYATTPVQRVIGAFEVAGVDQAPPAALWASHGHVGCIGRADYMHYFAGAENAYAIRVRRPRRWTEPLALEDLSPGLRAPQSYQYLRDDALFKIEALLDCEDDQTAARRLPQMLVQTTGRLVLTALRPLSGMLPLTGGSSGSDARGLRHTHQEQASPS